MADTAVAPAPEGAPAPPLSGIEGNDQPGKGVGNPKDSASSFAIVAFGVYLLVLSGLLFFLLIKLMPGNAGDTGMGTVNLFGDTFRLWPDTRLLLLALCAGALGSFIHTATSFSDFVGNRQLVKSWLWWYLLRPVIGSCLAVILYFSIRAGLTSAQGGASGLNAFGVVTVSALSGMFAKQATDKLREIFENMFKSTPPPRADGLQNAASTAAGKK